MKAHTWGIEMKRAEILALLRERREFVSGQELCERFGVSRTAVWKAVNLLKKEGYEIEAIQNRGYRLCGPAEVFGQAEISSRLDTRWAGRNLIYHAEVDSTNNLAKLEAEKGAPHGTVIVADTQTAGRGRRGRYWESPSEVSLYFTIVLRPSLEPGQASMLTLVMADAVGRAIERETGLRTGIKWPNDVVVNGKKVCGILTEMSAERDCIHYAVIGAGTNMKHQDFPPEIAEKATSLEEEGGSHLSRSSLLAAILEEFESDYDEFVKAGDLTPLLSSYESMLVNRDAQVCVLDPKGEFTGIARGITPQGELKVEKEGQTVLVYAGEVSVRGIYGYV